MKADHVHKTVQVGLDERSYAIRIERGILGRVGLALAEGRFAKRYAVVSDEHVAGLYGQRFMDSLHENHIPARLVTFPRGEQSKNLETIGRLASELAREGFDRRDGLIALGGGVTGDITGFLASIFMRSIPFVQVPTTLLAQVDSSVGGKTGVDIPEGKNLLGTFYQPRAVYIDTDVLQTLPEDELLGGLAEVIKYGVIADAEFFRFLREKREPILALQPDVITETIARCCAIKARIVEQDEREGDIRRILNYGHTFGHAIEAASGFSLIHGLAVAMGMCAAARLAERAGLLPQSSADEIIQLIDDFGMQTSIPEHMDRQRIKDYFRTDKKTVAGRVFFVLPTKIGEVAVTDKIHEKDIDHVLEE